MTLLLPLEMAASGYGERIALGSRTGGVSFAALHDYALGGATVVRDQGPDHVVFVGRNGPGYAEVMFACAAAGVPFVPLNYRLAADQLGLLLRQLSRPLVVADEDYSAALGAEYKILSTADFVAAAASAPRLRDVWTDDTSPAVILFTSGTTSAPKAVVLRHANLTAYIFATVDFGAAADSDAALVSVPPYHIAAVGSALSNIYAGRRVVHLPDFDARQWLDLVRDEQVTSAMLVPTMLARIIDVLGSTRADADTLRLLSYGGARMPRRVLEAALRAFPSTGFCNAYGLTETSSTIALLGPEEHRDALASSDPDVSARLGSVGRPVPGVEVAIRVGDRAASAGETGELWVRGAQVSGEYRGRGSALDNDGWFRTGDLARRDSGGYLFVEGRIDDTIIRGGENIAPAEIEEVLASHPAIKEVAVIGLPDDEWGERLCAVVVRFPGASVSADEVRDYARRHLRGSRTPDQVVWRTSLPQTATGKLLRRQLVIESADTVRDT
jgi:acyl-CoA synthetase (AMP-forming)/AMP-acid ligase II